MGLGFSSSSGGPGKAATRVMASLRHGSKADEAYVSLRKTPELFRSFVREEWLAPEVMALVEAAKRGEKHPALKEESEGIYSFDLFTREFCETFLAEVDNYVSTGLPVRRPNSMNNYGLIVNEIGMRPALTDLQQQVLQPLSNLLFPEVGYSFDAHHSFMVQYRPSEDLGLDMHTDDSDVTLNVCLGEDFKGAGLTFCGRFAAKDHRQFSFQYQHVVGRAVVHLGTRRHGADDISEGTRRNLIVWNHNHHYRRSAAYTRRSYGYRKEEGPPDLRCLSYTHDRDYAAYKTLPQGAKPGKRAWCPPPQACYDQMDDVFDKIAAGKKSESAESSSSPPQ